MTLQIDVHTPSISAGSVRVFRAGERNQRLMPGFPAVPRRTDLYTGADAVSSVGSWKMKVLNEDGLFSPDGLFAPDMKAPFVAASVSNRVVFLGKAVKLSYEAHKSGGVIASIHWRDFLDDFLTRQIDGVDEETVRSGFVPGSADEDREIEVIAQALLLQVMGALGFPRYRRANGAMVPAADVPLWYPENTTTIRQWLLPVFAALGLSYDWTATINAGTGTLTAGLRASWEGEFLNRASLPIFTDSHLLKIGAWDDGREQVANLWEGKFRWWDTEERRFQTRDVDVRVAYGTWSVANQSRLIFGERKSRIRFDQLRLASEYDLDVMVSEMLARRLWEHPRVRMTLQGAAAAGLRVGDGFITHFRLGIVSGRGLRRHWRVLGRTLVVREDARDASIEVYAEVRDGRDEDYRDWATNGFPSAMAPAP